MQHKSQGNIMRNSSRSHLLQKERNGNLIDKGIRKREQVSRSDQRNSSCLLEQNISKDKNKDLNEKERKLFLLQYNSKPFYHPSFNQINHAKSSSSHFPFQNTEIGKKKNYFLKILEKVSQDSTQSKQSPLSKSFAESKHFDVNQENLNHTKSKMQELRNISRKKIRNSKSSHKISFPIKRERVNRGDREIKDITNDKEMFKKILKLTNNKQNEEGNENTNLINSPFGKNRQNMKERSHNFQSKPNLHQGRNEDSTSSSLLRAYSQKAGLHLSSTHKMPKEREHKSSISNWNPHLNMVNEDSNDRFFQLNSSASATKKLEKYKQSQQFLLELKRSQTENKNPESSAKERLNNSRIRAKKAPYLDNTFLPASSNRKQLKKNGSSNLNPQKKAVHKQNKSRRDISNYSFEGILPPDLFSKNIEASRQNLSTELEGKRRKKVTNFEELVEEHKQKKQNWLEMTKHQLKNVKCFHEDQLAHNKKQHNPAHNHIQAHAHGHANQANIQNQHARSGSVTPHPELVISKKKPNSVFNTTTNPLYTTHGTTNENSQLNSPLNISNILESTKNQNCPHCDCSLLPQLQSSAHSSNQSTHTHAQHTHNLSHKHNKSNKSIKQPQTSSKLATPAMSHGLNQSQIMNSQQKWCDHKLSTTKASTANDNSFDFSATQQVNYTHFSVKNIKNLNNSLCFINNEGSQGLEEMHSFLVAFHQRSKELVKNVEQIPPTHPSSSRKETLVSVQDDDTCFS